MIGWFVTGIVLLAIGFIGKSIARQPRPKAKAGPAGSRAETQVNPLVGHVQQSVATAPDRDAITMATARPAGGDGKGAGDDPEEMPELDDELTDLPQGEIAGRVMPPSAPVPARAYLFESSEALGVEAGQVAFPPEAAWAGAQYPPTDEELPRDNLRVTARNGHSLVVSWRGDGQGAREIKEMLGDNWDKTTPVLRVYDVTPGKGKHNFSVELRESQHHKVIREGIQPQRRYMVSLERRTSDGQSYMVTHSLPVETPKQSSGHHH